MAATVAVIVMAIGLVGSVVPFVPGLPLVWIGAFVYGLAEGFGRIGIVAMTLITALMVGGIAVKYALAQRSARRSGAPFTTLALAAVLGFVGFFVVPVIGFIFGAVLGVFLAERMRLREWGPAWSSTKAVILAFGAGTLLEIGAGILMIPCWIVWWWLD